MARRGGLEAWSFSKASWTGSSDGSSVYAAGPSALSEMNVDDFALDSLCGTLRSFDDLIVFARRRIDSAASISGGCWSHWNSSIFSSSARTRAARPSAPSASSDEPSRSSAFAAPTKSRRMLRAFAASGGLNGAESLRQAKLGVRHFAVPLRRRHHRRCCGAGGSFADDHAALASAGVQGPGSLASIVAAGRPAAARFEVLRRKALHHHRASPART